MSRLGAGLFVPTLALLFVIIAVARSPHVTTVSRRPPEHGLTNARTPASIERTIKIDAIPLMYRSVVGHSVLGVPIQQLRLGNGSYRILILASIHGNESLGTQLLLRLADYLQENHDLLSDCTIALLPNVNPDGVKSQSRFNSQGVDLNRNFPAENRQNSRRFGFTPLSEPESLAIHDVILDLNPHHIVTLHEPLACVDYDGPALSLARAMSAECPLPVKKLGSRPGSLGSFAGVTLQIPTITFELSRTDQQQTDESLWRIYGNALLAAVNHRSEIVMRREDQRTIRSVVAE